MGSQSSSFDVLRAYLEARASFQEDELALIRLRFVAAALRGGEFLQRAGEISKWTAFVARGCLRRYLIDGAGKEHILQFAPETWWTADNASLATGETSQYFIDAIEDSEVLLIDPASHEELVERVPGYSAAYRKSLQKHTAARDERIARSLSASAAERYAEFLKTYPSIATRVPQWMLASHLGISPETLSRIRGQFARKGQAASSRE